MKLVDHGKDAASAEVQRLQRLALRYAIRVAFLVVAALFALFTLISAHRAVELLVQTRGEERRRLQEQRSQRELDEFRGRPGSA